MNNKEFPQQANMPYPYPMPYQENDEIDLVELFRTLWKQKVKIALVTAVTTLAAGIYAFTTEEVWTSKAVITAPKASDMGEFYQIAQEINRYAPERAQMPNSELSKKNNTVAVIDERVDGFSLYNLRESLYGDFKNELISVNNKNKFISKQFSSNGKRVNIDILFTPADGVKSKYDELRLSIGAQNGGKELLANYVNYINSIVIGKNKQELSILRNKFYQDLTVELKKIKINDEEQLKMEINVVNTALNQAKRINLNEPSELLPVEINDQTMYLLGAKALEARLVALHEAVPDLSVRFFEIEQQLKFLNAIKIADITGNSFAYIDGPNKPATRDKPKIMLMLMLGAIFGFTVSGVGLVVLLVIKKHNFKLS